MSETKSKRIPATQINNLVTADMRGLFDYGTLMIDNKSGDVLGALFAKDESLVASVHALHTLARTFKRLWDDDMKAGLTPKEIEVIEKQLATID